MIPAIYFVQCAPIQILNKIKCSKFYTLEGSWKIFMDYKKKENDSEQWTEHKNNTAGNNNSQVWSPKNVYIYIIA